MKSKWLKETEKKQMTVIDEDLRDERNKFVKTLWALSVF